MNGWRSWRLEPDDVLFFRDGRPSTRGADHYLRSLFPPHPSTLYGAVRTRRLLEAEVDLEGLGESTWADRLGEDLVRELGRWGGFGSLEMRGPWLVQDNAPLLPAPHDLGVVLAPPEEGKPPRAARVARYRPVSPGGAPTWSHPLARMHPFEADGSPWKGGPGTEPRPAVGWFLKAGGLAVWRRGGVPAPEDLVHPRSLWQDEARTGVGLERDRRLGVEGLIYTFGFIRLEKTAALGFEVKSSGLQAGGHVRLGGEGRTAALKEGPAFPAANGDLPTAGGGGLVSICFSTPALSASGGYPPGFTGETDAAGEGIRGTFGKRRLRLVAAAVQGFVTVGGWDVAKGIPKPLRRALLPGSVFLFDPEDGASPHDFDGQCFSDFQDECLAQQGFGLAVAGVGGILGQQNL